MKTYNLNAKQKFNLATPSQLRLLKTFTNVTINIFDNRFLNYCSKDKASEIIEDAKKGIDITINS
jgi:hypothetical protein